MRIIGLFLCPSNAVGRTIIWLILLSHFDCAVGASQEIRENAWPMHWEQLAVVPVAPENTSIFSTPIAYFDGSIFTANVEISDASSPSDYRSTVLRKGVLTEDGSWVWQSNVIEKRTIPDMFHTQPSLAIDRNGYLHVAYNMHNSPWQYLRSRSPGSILDLEFRGDPISDQELDTLWRLNKTSFPDAGTAYIPGNQITYPAFFQDRNRDIYVTYRFAIRPKRSWPERARASGIAKYDLTSQVWVPIGAIVPRSDEDVTAEPGTSAAAAVVFSYEAGFTPYLPRIFFDVNNAMHITWTWRLGGPGKFMESVSYAFSSDGGNSFQSASGEKLELPISREDSSIRSIQAQIYAFSSVSASTDSDPILIVQSTDRPGRELYDFDPVTGGWRGPSPSPWAAVDIYTDDSGREWAVASGIKVFSRKTRYDDWKLVIAGEGYCYPKPIFLSNPRSIIVHAKDCAQDKVVILRAILERK